MFKLHCNFKSLFLLFMFLLIFSGCGDNRTEEEKLRAYYEETKLYSREIESIVKGLEDKKISNEEAYKQLTAIMKKFDKLDPKIEALNFGEETGTEGDEICEIFYMNLFDDANQFLGFDASKLEYKVTAENRQEVLIFTKNILGRTAKDFYNSAMFYAQKCGSADSQAGSSAYSMGTNTTFLTLAGEHTGEDAIYSMDMLNFLFSKLDESKGGGS